MKIEYDSTRDLLYVWFWDESATAARTETLAPGVHADFNKSGQLMGIEVLEASRLLGGQLNVNVALTAAG